MSYRLEKGDIVISGFENGIADSPYQGIADMRNVDPISIPGEGSVALKTVNNQPQVTSATFTANAATDTLTWSGVATAGTVGNQLAITVSNTGGALPAGLSANTTYYVRNATATTFKLSATIGGSIIDITNAGSGTNSFATVSFSKPTYGCSYNPGAAFPITYSYFVIDAAGQAWWWNGTFWVFLNNTIDLESGGNGIMAWKGYLFVFKSAHIDYLPIATLTTSAWTTNWKALGGGSIHQALVGGTDEIMYFCDGSAVGSLAQVVAKTFDPTDGTTYTYNTAALQLPSWEEARCLGQLQTNILVGGSRNIVYNWDRISIGYNPIFIAENGTYRIVGVNTNAYLFVGDRGRIYITNGSQANPYKKVPDHISGTTNPLFTWGDASFSRNQLYFGIQASTNSGVATNQYGGVWAMDLTSDALRLQNKLSYGNYSGIASVIVPILGSDTNLGYGLFVGWENTIGGTDGMDVSASLPYTGGESIIDCDMIPVGTLLDPFTPSQLEWKLSTPLDSPVTGVESVALYYRLNLNASFTLLGTTNGKATVLGDDPNTGTISDTYPSNFEKAQWVQLRAVLTSNTVSPSYCRLTEIRMRNYPSGKNAT